MSKSASIPVGNDPQNQKRKVSGSPINRLMAEHKQKQIAFGFGIFCLLFAIVAQLMMVRAIKSEERVFVIDGANNLHIGPLEKIGSTSPLFQTIALTATQVVFSRSPVGLDLKELREHLFSAAAMKMLDDDVASQLDELKSKNLHQKAEVALIKTVAEKDDVRYIHVSGNLIGSGVFEGVPLFEAHRFKIHFALKKNPKLSEQKMYPYLVTSFKINELTAL